MTQYSPVQAVQYSFHLTGDLQDRPDHAFATTAKFLGEHPDYKLEDISTIWMTFDFGYIKLTYRKPA